MKYIVILSLLFLLLREALGDMFCFVLFFLLKTDFLCVL